MDCSWWLYIGFGQKKWLNEPISSCKTIKALQVFSSIKWTDSYQIRLTSLITLTSSISSILCANTPLCFIVSLIFTIQLDTELGQKITSLISNAPWHCLQMIRFVLCTSFRLIRMSNRHLSTQTQKTQLNPEERFQWLMKREGKWISTEQTLFNSTYWSSMMINWRVQIHISVLFKFQILKTTQCTTTGTSHRPTSGTHLQMTVSGTVQTQFSSTEPKTSKSTSKLRNRLTYISSQSAASTKEWMLHFPFWLFRSSTKILLIETCTGRKLRERILILRSIISRETLMGRMCLSN